MLNTKQLPRPLRRAVSDVAASLPIPYVVTCAGMKLPWPAGHAQDKGELNSKQEIADARQPQEEQR